ncbi:hypothetical protein RDZ95_000449 [Campylobacter upsaliensis]|uniref:Bacteriocin-type signal sequence domain-containing protein n=2 Tax=Campylobacter upsaliensis TaxID=28080 RepID=A0A5L4F225_CAMUP|nr:hypothetical protein [Campylobacter upsaliensis]HDX3742739.1 hypothetical protein [Campylobacter jejuni]EAH5200663.1 hypothetical protein [Campylobacter upsaliensis]EAH5218289.1 hypothetical protein [Campylobacter upsaliensis]EAI1981012.1 hypothetical protein [Campylobacter upsaliensis]EAI2901422.1 hypothetical protein [Campylobacter upsaliensis]
MFKKLLSVTALGALLASSAFAEDILAKVSNGAISDNSAGVKVLSLDEMKEVKGGYYFKRDSAFDYNAGSLSSYGYVVMDNSVNQNSNAVTQSLGYSSGYIVAKYRYVNNQKDYYLQYFSSKYGSGTNIWAYANSPAYNILNEFKSKY